MVVYLIRIGLALQEALDDFLAVLYCARSDPFRVTHVAVRLLRERQTVGIDAESLRTEGLQRRRERHVQRRPPLVIFRIKVNFYGFELALVLRVAHKRDALQVAFAATQVQ